MAQAELAINLPRVMVHDDALRLVEVLKNASLRGRLVQNMAIERVGEEEGYVLRVSLEEVGSQVWDMHFLRRWSQDGDLVLAGNRALIFPDRYNNRFAILDKQKFVSLLLRSSVYAKVYEGDDVLDGEVILHRVRRFSFVRSLRLGKSRDFHGYRHEYVLDLSNGQRELISYRQALRVLEKGYAGTAPKGAQIIERLNEIKEIRVLPLKPNKSQQAKRFGMELVYANPVKLSSQHYRLQLREQRGALLGAFNNYFNLEIMLPSAILPEEISVVEKVGFLRKVRVVRHPDYPDLLVLSARISTDFLTANPHVQVNGNTVQFVFTQLQDLTVFDAKALAEAEQQRKQQLITGKKLSPEDIRDQKRYQQHMQTAISQLNRALSIPVGLKRFQLEASSLLNFVEASKNVNNEIELISILKERDRLIASLTYRLADFAEEFLNSGLGNPNSIVPLLRQVEPFAITPELQQRFQSLIDNSQSPRL